MATDGPDREVFELLAGASTATIQSQLFRRGLRNTFLYGVRPLNPSSAFVGEAFTLRFIPSREDIDVIEAFRDPHYPQREAIESLIPGQVLVVDSRSTPQAASAGDILVTRMGVLGAAALVTDGSVRDSGKIRELAFPVYAAGVSAAISLTAHHAADFQVPIGCGGVAVYPGDVLVGDDEGVVVIPRALSREVASAARDQEELEEYIKARVRGGAPLPGTYPPDQSVLDDFERDRARSTS